MNKGYTSPELEVCAIGADDVLTNSIIMPPHILNPSSEDADRV